MSRHIDRFPAPAEPEHKKLIVLSAPRTGTLGLYHALQILGFKPYHMAEVLTNGADHARFLSEGVQASTEGTFQPYGRAEFDKWFAGYDIVVEMPFFMLTEVVQAYPDGKFLLMERDPDKWATSWLNTIGPLTLKFTRFPTNLLKYFDPLSRVFGDFSVVIRRIYLQSDENGPEAHHNLVEHYKKYIAKVKAIVPPQQLKGTEWPGRNKPEEFFKISNDALSGGKSKALILASVLAPLVAVGIWYAKADGAKWLPKIF
ncbi:tubulin [Apiospora kogelbergensis]|uniref:Tubulin n=1 Tax=Apiospora kogelbergensis TaxID=1337665 RepID=A0AAW0R9L6_9PEZI